MSADSIGFALLILGLALLIGKIIRVRVGIVQSLFLPSSIVGGALLLSRAPWPDPAGYAGDTAGPQVVTMLGLACAGVAAAWPGARESARRASARSRARRAGSSTRA